MNKVVDISNKSTKKFGDTPDLGVYANFSQLCDINHYPTLTRLMDFIF